MSRPWVPIGYLPTRPTQLEGGHEIVSTLVAEHDPIVALVLMEGREYLTKWEAGRWVVSIR